MKKCVVDPNRALRVVWSVFALVLVLFGGYSCVIAVFNPTMPPFFALLAFLALVMWVFGCVEWPYVVLSEAGVTYRFFFRKRTVSWDALVQTGVMFRPFGRIEAYWYPLVLVLPGGTPRRGKEKALFLARNALRCLILPGSEEITEFVKCHYGEPDFHDFEDLNDWEKKYHKSVYKVRKEKEK